MNKLLYDKLLPITFSIGFLNCSFGKVQDAFIQWKKQHFKAITVTEVNLPFDLALEKLQPLTVIARRWLLMSTTGNWVAYFDNCNRGPDPVATVSYLAEQLACRGVIASSIPNTLCETTGTKSGLYGATQFQLFSSQKTAFLNYERTVSVVNDGGRWRFNATGAVQSFENTTTYMKRRIMDRFTPEILKKYCHALGILIDSADFYRAPAVLVVSNDQLPTIGEMLTLAQVQKQLGI